MTTLQLTPDMASKFATLALGHLTREYPNKLTHALAGPQDVQSPRALHPIFYGSYDWHSCVHGYWLVLHLLGRFADLPERERIIATVERNFTAAGAAGECAYLELAHNKGFERPYGWAWLLALVVQLDTLKIPQAARWTKIMVPLAEIIIERFEDFLPSATYPLRVGTHFNTAFALVLALDFAMHTGHTLLVELITDTAIFWYRDDADCQAWEPGGDEFLSPALMEAHLMSRVLPSDEFNAWFTRFLPHLDVQQPATLFTPATVSDRSDGKIAHLDGLNLSRAWCQRSLARALPRADARRPVLLAAASRHLASAIDHVAGDYMGEHWLATFATLALEA